jgi:hypothetical protein
VDVGVGVGKGVGVLVGHGVGVGDAVGRVVAIGKAVERGSTVVTGESSRLDNGDVLIGAELHAPIRRTISVSGTASFRHIVYLVETVCPIVSHKSTARPSGSH